jgi:hypothetical protein
MIPLDPFAIHVQWFLNWRKHVKMAHQHPLAADLFSRSASVAQMEYETLRSIFTVDTKARAILRAEEEMLAAIAAAGGGPK